MIIFYYSIILYYIFYHVFVSYHIALSCQTISHWKTFYGVIGFPNVTFSLI